MKNQNIAQLFEQSTSPLFSLEFFPPKDHLGFAMLGSAVEQLKEMQPDFVTVTYGAGGTTRKRTMAVCELLDRIMDCPVMPHLTCVGAGRDELEEVIDEIYDKGFRNIMALRGDPPKGETTFTPAPDGLRYAAELVQLIGSRHPDICCGVAGYPEVHPEAESAETDAIHLKDKLDAGGRFVTTQLFFENHYYFDYVERCRALGITQPILPGLLPAVSLGQLERVMTLSQSAFPEELAEQLRAAGGKGPKAQAVGIEWTIRQIDELIAHGAPGAHLYIFNRAQTALYPPLAACIQKHRSGVS